MNEVNRIGLSSGAVGPNTPGTPLENLLAIQRDLLDQLSGATCRAHRVFAKALAPDRCGQALSKDAEPSPDQAPILDALQSNNALLQSILHDLQAINDRSVL